METPPAASLTWTQLAINVLVGLLASGATYVGLLLNRKKPAAEIHESYTRSDLNTAQAEHLKLQDNLSAGELLSRIFQQLYEANRRSDQLVSDLESAKKEIGKIPVMEAELMFLNAEVQRARAQGFLSDNRGQANPAA